MLTKMPALTADGAGIQSKNSGSRCELHEVFCDR